MKRSLVMLGLLTLTSAAYAGDGALEINQACVATGCFPGDTPGFPVLTQSGRKYVLTSDLIVPSANTTAIAVGPGATLDLNGFSILGVTTCTGVPAVCSNTGSGSGVTLDEGAAVRNGSIRGMGLYGVFFITKLVLVEDLWIDQNGAGGIGEGVADGAAIRGCRVSRNGGTGIGLAGGNASPGSIVSDNVVYANAGAGIQVTSALIRDNNIRSNGGFGIQASYIDSSSGFVGNVINGNNGGNANPQTSGSNQIGSNVCGADTICP